MGLGLLYGCDNDTNDYNINQNVYTSYEQCMQDWGGSVQSAKQNGFDDVCQPTQDASIDMGYNNNANNNTTVIVNNVNPTPTVVHTYYAGPRYYTLPNGTVRTFFRKDGKSFIGSDTTHAPQTGKIIDTHQSYTDTHSHDSVDSATKNSATKTNDASKVNQTNKGFFGNFMKSGDVAAKTATHEAPTSHFESVEPSSIHASSISEHSSSISRSIVSGRSGSVARSGFGGHATGHASAGG